MPSFIFIVLAAVAVLVAFLAWKNLEQRRHVERVRKRLASLPAPVPLTDERLVGLPEPVRRYLRHALPVGAPLASLVKLQLRQEIKARKTDSASEAHILEVEQWLSRAGSVGEGVLRRGLGRHATFWYLDGKGAGRETSLGYPLISNTGPHSVKVLQRRFLHELILLPPALLPDQGVTWTALDDRRIRAELSLDGEKATLDLTIGPDGNLLEAVSQRWASVGTGGVFQDIPFGFVVDGERSFDGYTIPSRLRGGFWYGTDRYVESFHLEIEAARFS
jgi:hypothetical protein